MTDIFKKLFVVLMLAGVYGVSIVFAQTGAKIIPRDRTSPSIHEGASGERSAGVKTNVDPLVGRVPATYSPFRGFPAVGSLVQSFSATAPTPGDPASVGFKFIFSQIFHPLFSVTGRTNRLFAGTKGLGGENITDVGGAGERCGTGPGDRYWVGFPRPANPQQLDPPLYQYPAHPDDCACRCGEQIYCAAGFNPAIRYAPYGGLNPGPVACEVCYGPANLGFDAILKHDIYVGTDHGTHNGYGNSFPSDTGYLECLRQNQGDPSGGSPGNANYGL